MKTLITTLTNIMLRGTATLIPIFVTAYFIYWMLTLLENLTQNALLYVLPEGAYFVGLGTLILLVIIFLCGLAMSEIHTEKVFRYIEKHFCRIPIIKSIYGISKDFMDYFARQRSADEFGQVVSVNFDEAGVKMVGFVTLEDISEHSTVLNENSNILVYLPMGYQIGGYTIAVSRSKVEALDMNFEQAMRFILTAGLSQTSSAEKDSSQVQAQN